MEVLTYFLEYLNIPKLDYFKYHDAYIADPDKNKSLHDALLRIETRELLRMFDKKYKLPGKQQILAWLKKLKMEKAKLHAFVLIFSLVGSITDEKEKDEVREAFEAKAAEKFVKDNQVSQELIKVGVYIYDLKDSDEVKEIDR